MECGSEESGIGVGKDERRAKLDDVVVRAVGTGKDAAITETIDDVGGLIGCGGMSRAVIDKIDTQE